MCTHTSRSPASSYPMTILHINVETKNQRRDKEPTDDGLADTNEQGTGKQADKGTGLRETVYHDGCYSMSLSG
jgi:hypothetical protein